MLRVCLGSGFRVVHSQVSLQASMLSTLAAAEPLKRLNIAVVGGGVAGSACAWRIAQHGHHAEVFDLGRHFPGGRSATKRVSNQSGLQFDHGAQFFVATRPEVKELMTKLQQQGGISQWTPRLALVDASSGSIGMKGDAAVAQQPGFFNAMSSASTLYVGSPTMDSLCQTLLNSPGVELRLGTKVATASFDTDRNKWQLSGTFLSAARQSGTTSPSGGAAPALAPLGEYDALVLADILCARKGSPGYVNAEGNAAAAALGTFYSAAGALPRAPLFSLLMAFDGQQGRCPDLPFDAACISGGQGLAWLACDSSKPGRSRSDGLQCWVAITTEALAAQLVGPSAVGGGLPPQDAAYLGERAALILEAVRADLQIAGLELPEPVFMQAHRWGSAYATTPLGLPCLSDSAVRFAAAGDFCLGAGVENAIVSGMTAADAVMAPRQL